MLVLFLILTVLLILGAPVAVALGLSSLVYVVLNDFPDVVVFHNMLNGVNSFTLIAVPFFILAGNLMNSGGITERIFSFARACVGWLRGGLGHVNIGGSIIFAGMSGAAVADAGGLGNVEIKAMKDAGYDADFSVGITAASSTIGPIIPPSLPLIVYGVVGNASIGKLFAAGIIPGFMMAVALMIMVVYFAKKRNYPKDDCFRWAYFWHTLKHAFAPLLTPVIIIGGILSGVFTPTESAVAAVAYAMFLGVFVYKTLNLKSLIKVSIDTIEMTSSLVMIVATSSIFAWILTANQVANELADMLLGFTTDPNLILLVILVITLVVGCFMETLAAITILVPILLPIAISIGVDPVHFGIILVLNLMIGLLTPPVGMVLYVLSKVANVSFERCVKATAPFLIPLVGVLLILTFFPKLTMWLPNLLYK